MVQHWPSPFPRCGLLSLHLFDRYSIFECRKYSRTSSVDSINMDITASSTVWLLAGSLILGCTSFWFSSLSLVELSLDGAARIDVTLSGELLNAIFANIGLRAIRKVARETLEHLLNLDMKFHLERQTGCLTRAIGRGTISLTFDQLGLIYYSRGITFLLQSGHIPYRTHCFGNFNGVRHFSTSLVNSLPKLSSSEDNLCRHTDLDGNLLWQWWQHTLGSFWGLLHGG